MTDFSCCIIWKKVLTKLNSYLEPGKCIEQNIRFKSLNGFSFTNNTTFSRKNHDNAFKIKNGGETHLSLTKKCKRHSRKNRLTAIFSF